MDQGSTLTEPELQTLRTMPKCDAAEAILTGALGPLADIPFTAVEAKTCIVLWLLRRHAAAYGRLRTMAWADAETAFRVRVERAAAAQADDLGTFEQFVAQVCDSLAVGVDKFAGVDLDWYRRARTSVDATDPITERSRWREVTTGTRLAECISAVGLLSELMREVRGA